MKKIPTLFERTFEDHKVAGISDKVTPGLEWVLKPDAPIIPTIKFDGSCVGIFDGKLYRRYDAKKKENYNRIPAGSIPCEIKPDPITGHWPHWAPISPDNPADKWYIEAYNNRVNGGMCHNPLSDGTYEAIGPHFQGNPYKLDHDLLTRHGIHGIHEFRGNQCVLKRFTSFEQIRDFLKETEIEGIVFWSTGDVKEPICKIKRSDFGFKWPAGPKLNLQW